MVDKVWELWAEDSVVEGTGDGETWTSVQRLSVKVTSCATPTPSTIRHNGYVLG